MSTYKLSKRSLSRLDGVHPELVDVVKLAITKTTLDFMVIEGLRTIETQREYVAKGASNTMKSKHLLQSDGYGHAVDLAPLVDGEIPWNDAKAFALVADVMKQSAHELAVSITWGGDWKSFYDGPHFQIEAPHETV